MLKSSIKKSIRSLGFDITRYQPSSSNDARFITMLKSHNINLIFDIGANTGQFGRQMRNASFKGRIVSFEPLSSAYKKLLASSSNDPLWEVAPPAAIGSEDGEIEIHIAGNSVSSSVLNMLDTHSNAAPESSYVGSEKVTLRRLDTIAKGYIGSKDIFFLKIDTQGYEDQVLKGATEIIKRATGVQLELSLVQLYEGQRLYDDIILDLKKLGFDLWDISTAFVEPQTGRLLQIDATFFRS